MEESEPTRRKILRYGLGLGAAAATGGLASLTGKALDNVVKKHETKVGVWSKEYDKDTRVGQVRILNKIIKKHGESLKTADVISGAFSGYMLGKLSAAPGGGPMFSIANALKAMGTEDKDYYLVIEVTGKKPIVHRSYSGEFKSLAIGEMVPAKYHVKPEDKENVEWVELNPPTSAITNTTSESDDE